MKQIHKADYGDIYCIINSTDTRYIISNNLNSCKKLTKRSKALIREYSSWETQKKKQYIQHGHIFQAYPCLYAQPVYYEGIWIRNPPRMNKKSLVRYDFQTSIIEYDENGYCDDMILMPRKDISGLHGGKEFPSILKIVPIKETMYFIRFMNQFLSQRLSQLQGPKSNYSYQYKIIPNHVKSTDAQPFPSPNCSPDQDDIEDANDNIPEAAKEQNQTQDSDGDQFMQDCDQQSQVNNNKNNDNNNNVQENLASTQIKHFLNKKYIKPQIKSKHIKGAIRKCKKAKVQAQSKNKSSSRIQIPFSTKHNFCLMVESGMGKLDAWRWCRDNGYEVGKSASGCGRWARKGSNYYLNMIAKHGDAFKFCFILLLFKRTHH